VERVLTAVMVGAACCLMALPVQAAGAIDLRAEAGLGGWGRPGRWTPVRVTIATESDLAGEVVLDWGETHLHRDLELAASSRIALELYIRTTDVRGSIAVRVLSNGSAVASVDVPVQMVRDDERLVVCVGDADERAGCTTVVAPTALPGSLRGYVAADDVRIPATFATTLGPEQRTALSLWRVYRDLDAQGLLTRAPRAPVQAATADGIAMPTAAAMAAVSLSLLAVVWLWGERSTSPRASYVALAGALVAASLGAAISGRLGPGASIVVRHATTVQQLGEGALVSMRGTFEYPAFGEYAIRLSPVDGALAERFARAEVLWLDATGAPIRRGTFGRARREEVEIEAIAAYAPFDVGVDGDIVRVSNRSATTLTGCRFPEGFSGPEGARLVPGGSLTARVTAAGDAPYFSCDAPVPPVVLTDADFPLRLEGATVVSVLLPVLTGEVAP
jgi:hypothetical protein